MIRLLSQQGNHTGSAPWIPASQEKYQVPHNLSYRFNYMDYCIPGKVTVLHKPQLQVQPHGFLHSRKSISFYTTSVTGSALWIPAFQEKYQFLHNLSYRFSSMKFLHHRRRIRLCHLNCRMIIYESSLEGLMDL